MRWNCRTMSGLAVLLACGSQSHAQIAEPAPLNPGFETPLSGTLAGSQVAKFWRELSGAAVRRRFVGDTLGGTVLVLRRRSLLSDRR